MTLACLPAVHSQIVKRLPPVGGGQPASAAPASPGFPVRQASADVEKTADTTNSYYADFLQPPEQVGLPPLQMENEPFASGANSDDDGVFPIDLPAALRLADRANPEIGIARQGVLESLAVRLKARVILLPTLNGGGNLHIHSGTLQRSPGTILRVSSRSLYLGGGARTLAAESIKYPMISIYANLTDAIFKPLAAQQRVVASRFTVNSTFNTILRDVSDGYIDLMAAEARLAVFEESYANAMEVVRTTTNFAEIGQERQADADRAQTEAALLNSQLQQAIAERTIASAELCRLLNLDPTMRLTTVGGPIPVLELVDRSYTVEQLISVAMRMRPDLQARNAEVAEMELHYRQERLRPILPTIGVGFSAGAFGGGSNLQQPPYNVPSAFSNLQGRTDFDVAAFWTMERFGIGNVAKWRTRRAERDQNIAKRVRTLNLVARASRQGPRAVDRRPQGSRRQPLAIDRRRGGFQ